jgi:hypothetical protein
LDRSGDIERVQRWRTARSRSLARRRGGGRG